VRSQEDLYMDELAASWQRKIHDFKHHAYFSESKSTLASKIVTHHSHNLIDWQIVLSGPFDMVYNIRDVLAKEGVPMQNLFSDAFSFEGK
jgi:CDP-4-dehydro-6-deoxyglucose reductase